MMTSSFFPSSSPFKINDLCGAGGGTPNIPGKYLLSEINFTLKILFHCHKYYLVYLLLAEFEELVGGR